ncbi:hypothetical protein FBQ96_03635 [Nitrospirales bacterium NOB]|nr:MAG: hypothetical protein UZ03_NOB001001772 [Nitrospira sp. OLB3]MDL1888670.1 hypothetical protein [Nitrospirales bacterium NOB]MEB2337220.1 hypothetical protein [Nitrospirales bacterium]QOJ36710.1 MAG: hypothetical protein HRU82_17910 [Nitrospira sp.]
MSGSVGNVARWHHARKHEAAGGTVMDWGEHFFQADPERCRPGYRPKVGGVAPLRGCTVKVTPERRRRGLRNARLACLARRFVERHGP